tara:strand:+ start:279 stop:713 length:435 start_codon:yes stop_codon:yes gene_type:complete
MPICPFIQGDLHTGNIKFMVYNSTMDKSLIEMIDEWDKSNFKTGLILHIGDDLETIKRKPYQKFLNEELKRNKMGDVKILCFSPFEDFNIAGVDTRKMAPCMLYNLAKREDLNKAGEKLLKTKWYDNLLTEDFKILNVKKKKIL